MISDERAQELRAWAIPGTTRSIATREVIELLDDREELLRDLAWHSVQRQELQLNIEAFEENEVELNAALRKLLDRIEKLEREVGELTARNERQSRTIGRMQRA